MFLIPTLASSRPMRNKDSMYAQVSLHVGALALQEGVSQTESLLHRAVNFVWEAEADYHSISMKKKKKKKKSVTIKDDNFAFYKKKGSAATNEAAILDMKVTARGNNISGGFAQVPFLARSLSLSLHVQC